MRRNILLVIAYDGTPFHGWQQQPNVRTVQGEIQASAARVLNQPVFLAGSGRTDAGVHAAGQVANLHADTHLSPERLMHAIGGRIPREITLIRARDVSPAFHASRCAVSKLYRYCIHNAPGRPAEHLRQRYTYHCWHPLDVQRMRAGAEHLVGTHDFAAMATRGAPRETTVRTVLRCEVYRRGDEVRVDVEGTGFLYNQVRNMVGTLVEVGRGHWEPEKVAEIIASRDRARAGPTAPAMGLCLQWVRYPPALMRAAEGLEYAEQEAPVGDEAPNAGAEEPRLSADDEPDAEPQ